MSSIQLAGVIGGTQVDTRLGQRFLAERGWRSLSYPISQSPQEQDFLQRHHPQVLQAFCAETLREIEAAGAALAVIYCSSLSSVVDLAALRREVAIPILTPLDFYAALANEYAHFAVLAANSAGLRGAAHAIFQANPTAAIIGAHDLQMVQRIEDGVAPAHAITAGAGQFIREAEGHADVLVLACTHFPYVSPYLQTRLTVPVRDINGWLAQHLPYASHASVA